MTAIKIKIGPDVICPHCGVKEVENPDDPIDQWKFNIRAYKVCDKNGNWWSHCNWCRKWFKSKT